MFLGLFVNHIHCSAFSVWIHFMPSFVSCTLFGAFLNFFILCVHTYVNWSSNLYDLSHRYKHGTDYKITCACLSVCQAVVTPAAAIFIRFWRHFAQWFGTQKARSGLFGVKFLWLFFYFSPFYPRNAFSMGRFWYHGMEAQWPIVAVNSSEDMSRAYLKKN